MPSIAIKVHLRGIDPLIARLDLMPFVMHEEGRRGMDKAVDAVKRHVQVLTPVGEWTHSETPGMIFSSGHLRTSIKGESQFSLTDMTGRVYTNVPYAPYVEEGHGEILPKAGRFLRFRPRGVTHIVYARRVRPVAGVHMFREGLLAALPEIRAIFRQAMEAVARKMRG